MQLRSDLYWGFPLWCLNGITTTFRKNETMAAHALGEAATGLQHIADPLAGDQPFGKRSRETMLTLLAGRDEADDADLIGAETGTAGLMIANPPTGMALDRFNQARKSGERVPSVCTA